MTNERSDAFDAFVETLIAGGRPSPDQVVDDEGPLARLAAELAAAGEPSRGDPDPAFVDQLRLRMRDADAGIVNVQGWALPGAERIGRVRLTRRDVLRVGLGAAAGLAAGGAAISILRAPSRPTLSGDGALVRDGEWVAVASLSDLSVGGAVRFSTAAFDGYVVNDAGTIRALSSVCTHMGCTLTYRPAWQDLRCPCHGASFDLKGWLANGQSSWSGGSGYRGDTAAYPIDLPPLVRPKVKISGDQVLVWTAKT